MKISKTRSILIGGLALTSGMQTSGLKAQSNKNPNIVFIMTDQQTASAMSCAGDMNLKTPVMDELANHGVRFTNAYCSQPLSGPSRSSIFTGKMPHEVGVTVNVHEMEGYWKNIPMMGSIIKKSGYQTGYVGKWHMPMPSGNIKYHGFDYIRNTKRRDWQDASIPADCADFIKLNKNKPFLLVASFINPHDICEWARNQKLRMDMIGDFPEINLCPELPLNYDIPKDEPSIIREQQKFSPRTYPTTKWGKNQWREYRWAYSRLVEKVDSYVGIIVEALRRNGLLENTIIIFTSDHGDGCGSHQWNQKQVLYQESINIPLIISHKGSIKPYVDNKHIINIGTDIIPTICEIVGIKIPKYLKGRSFNCLVNNNDLTWRKHTVVETEFSLNTKSYGIKGRTLITNKYKYIVYDKGENREQLFDLENDPGETKSLVKSHKSILTKLRDILRIELKKTNDNFKL